jgi:hypothetical protein
MVHWREVASHEELEQFLDVVEDFTTVSCVDFIFGSTASVEISSAHLGQAKPAAPRD